MSSGAEQFLFKMWKFHLLAQFREKNRLVPFIFTIPANKLRTDCKHLGLIPIIDRNPPWGNNHPGCSEEDFVNAYPHNRQEFQTCINCPKFKKNKGESVMSRVNLSETKRQKRKDRKANKVKVTKTLEGQAPGESKAEYQKRRRKERREARKK